MMPSATLARELARLPAAAGLYLLRERHGRALRLGVAENLNAELNAAGLPSAVTEISAFPLATLAELPARYRQLLSEHQPRANPLPLSEPGYPFLSLTGELCPRLQVVRRPEADAYGPVLPPYALPEVLEQLTRLFKLRSCHETLDGSWPLPCLEYFRKRCLAPCVRELCDEAMYAAAVSAARSLLCNDDVWLRELEQQMHAAVEREDFETAAQWRDRLQAAQALLTNENFVIGLSECNDVLTLTEEHGQCAFHLTTRRNRKKLGELLFRFENAPDLEPAALLEHLLLWHYGSELPREIKLPFKVPHQALLQRSLSALSDGRSKLTATAAPAGVLARFAAQRAGLKQRERLDTSESDAATELQKALQLPAPPRCVQSYDVAHLAGQNTIAAVITWRAETPESLSRDFYLLDGYSEPEAMQEAVRRSAHTADLLLVDGGKTQLRRAQAALQSNGLTHIHVLAAVKPAGQSHLISHFLLNDESKLQLAPTTAALRLLYRLRDAAHATANVLHRQAREAAMLPALTRLLPDLSQAERQALLHECGSLNGILKASATRLRRVLAPAQAQSTAQRLRRLSSINNESAEEAARLPIVITNTLD